MATEAEVLELVKRVAEAPIDAKNFIDDDLRTAIFRKLRARLV